MQLPTKHNYNCAPFGGHSPFAYSSTHATADIKVHFVERKHLRRAEEQEQLKWFVTSALSNEDALGCNTHLC